MFSSGLRDAAQPHGGAAPPLTEKCLEQSLSCLEYESLARDMIGLYAGCTGFTWGARIYGVEGLYPKNGESHGK